MSSSEPDIVVVGAGPVGLSTALQLGRSGVRTLVVERHDGYSRHPKAIGIHAPTMELFRQWGIADNARSVGLPPERTMGVTWMTRLNGTELGAISFLDADDKMAEYAGQSPEFPLFAPQHRIEPLLAAAAQRTGFVDIALSTTASELRQEPDGVDVVLTNDDGGHRRVRSGFVVAADGVRSPIRTAHSFDEDAASYGESVSIHFRADLDPIVAGRSYLLWWIVNAEIQATFWPTGPDTWILSVEGDPAQSDDHYNSEWCVDLIRRAAGAPELAIEFLTLLRWRHEQAVARRWRNGRILLVGDSAHRFPPHGGFGMNSGIQDGANLAWKLAAVLRGHAGEALLDTYETERRPVARFNADQVALNTKRMEQTGWLLNDPSLLSDLELPSGERARQRFAAAIPHQREQFHSQGQQFGQIYTSDAVVADGTAAPETTVDRYHPSAHPGARCPHLWLQDADGARLSTIDLLGRDFVLLTHGPDRWWRRAADRVGAELGVTVSVHEIGTEELRVENPGDVGVLEVDPGGAVLVRPDSHVGYRSKVRPDDPTAELHVALRAILARA